MIELEKLQEHLQTLTTNDWNKLFVLLPEIESAKKFGEVKGGDQLKDGSFNFPYWDSSEIVHKVFHIIHELNLVPIFDWASWNEGKSMLKNQEFDYSTLDTITLCKLLTTIVRADRFNDGFLVMNFENGVMTQIIKTIRQNEGKESDSY
jgi:hypothetical protein